jgi:enoyl-CoA hydratase/carnithine racemase
MLSTIAAAIAAAIAAIIGVTTADLTGGTGAGTGGRTADTGDAGAITTINLGRADRLVTPEAFFLENWIELGIVPPLGGMFLLPRLIGLERATNMVMRGVRVSGEEAVAIGLATKLVASEALAAEAQTFAEDLARRSPAALAVAKAGLRRGMESTLAGEWEFNVQAQSILISGADFRAAVSALDNSRREGR